jgi:hypothetical protein
MAQQTGIVLEPRRCFPAGIIRSPAFQTLGSSHQPDPIHGLVMTRDQPFASLYSLSGTGRARRA